MGDTKVVEIAISEGFTDDYLWLLHKIFERMEIPMYDEEKGHFVVAPQDCEDDRIIEAMQYFNMI